MISLLSLEDLPNERPSARSILNKRISVRILHGTDIFTAAPQAIAMLYRERITKANILSYADDFWLLLDVYCSVLPLIPFMCRVRSRQDARGRRSGEAGARAPGLPAPAD